MDDESTEIFEGIRELIHKHAMATGYRPTSITITNKTRQTIRRGLKLTDPVTDDAMTMFGLPVKLMVDGDLPYFVEGL